MKIFVTVLFISAVISGFNAKKYTECELAVELVQHGFPRASINDWVCLVKSESGMDTKLTNIYNKDGSKDWGLFQINDRYWCKGSARSKNVCGFNCKSLMVDSMPSFETKCVQKIYKQSGGFSAWEGWKAKCRGKSLPSMDHCFKTGFDTVFEEYEEDGQFDSSEYTAENSVAVQKIIPPFWCSFFKPEKFPQTDEFARIWCE